MNYEAVKQAASKLMCDMIRAGFSNSSRNTAATAIREALRGAAINGSEERFMGNYMMSCLGYGGGL